MTFWAHQLGSRWQTAQRGTSGCDGSQAPPPMHCSRPPGSSPRPSFPVSHPPLPSSCHLCPPLHMAWFCPSSPSLCYVPTQIPPRVWSASQSLGHCPSCTEPPFLRSPPSQDGPHPMTDPSGGKKLAILTQCQTTLMAHFGSRPPCVVGRGCRWPASYLDFSRIFADRTVSVTAA